MSATGELRQEQPAVEREHASVEEGRRRFGELLGLREAVSEQVLVAALENQTYARNLLATRGVPELMEALLANPPAPRAQPSTLALASSAAKALVRWGKTGFTVLDEASYQRRLAACASCPHQIEATRHPTLYRVMSDGEHPKVCGLCGCAIARKARLASEQCPAPHQERPGFTRWGEPRVENNERVQQGAATTSE